MRQIQIRVGAALTIALSVAGLAWWQGPAQASYPGENGLIAWTRPGFLVDSEIWVMNPNGSAQRALTDNASNDADPAWSADGSRLVFESVTGNAFNLYVINADGTDLHQLTTSTNRTDVQPAWSPDGTKVAFSRQKMDGTGAIWIIDADGTNLHRITGEGSQNAHPNWSPDGSLIVFESDRSGGHDLYTMTPGGQNKTNITNTLVVQEGNPNWSPDGTQIAFDSCPAPSYPCPGNADYNVFVMDADGTGLRQLTTSPKIDQNPAWSPNGRQIVFRSDATGNTEIFAMRVDGSEMRMLTSGLNGGVDPDWQPLPT